MCIFAMLQAHLGAHNFIHRDLATRNVLLASGMVCKIADFGLSRGVLTEDNVGDYYRRYSTSGRVVYACLVEFA